MHSDSYPNGTPHILVVDDEPLVRRSLSEFLTLQGYCVSTAEGAVEALELLKKYTADIVITDIKMPEISGIQLLRRIKKEYSDTPVILITGYGSIESAVETIKEGAYDYVTKPIMDGEIKLVIERLINQRSLQEKNIKLKEQLSHAAKERFHNIIGKDERMQKIYTLIEAVSSTRATVLIYGESGTGKRLIAHAIHKYNEQERGKPFIEVSCGALTETLLESELFGHVKGSFTGAIKDRTGRFELADGGSIFLDEIDASSPALQVKLLRVLQDGEFERVGDAKTIKVDVRVIAATNQNLQELISQEKFRKDLYYRLNIISIEIPPLRERCGDIPLLVNEFIKKHSGHTSKKIEGIANDALMLLMQYPWPGNVRELENVMERAVILSKEKIITLNDLPKYMYAKTATNGRAEDSLSLRDALKSPEKEFIMKALESASWNRNEAACILGINRTTLYKKMQRFGLLKNTKSHARKE
jgi:DNA-binding NtrC family response regulator